jgi:hypothetical protein
MATGERMEMLQLDRRKLWILRTELNPTGLRY